MRQWRVAVPALMLPALGNICLFYLAPLVVAGLVGHLAGGGDGSVGALLPYVLGFGGLLLAGEVLWRVGLHFLNRTDARGIERLGVVGMDELLAKDAAFFHDNFAGSLTKRVLGFSARFEDFVDTLDVLDHGQGGAAGLRLGGAVAAITRCWSSFWWASSSSPASSSPRSSAAGRRWSTSVRPPRCGCRATSPTCWPTWRRSARSPPRSARPPNIGPGSPSSGGCRCAPGTTATSGWTPSSPRYRSSPAPLGLLLAVALRRRSGRGGHRGDVHLLHERDQIMFEFNQIYRRMESVLTEAAQFTELLLVPPTVVDPADPQPLRPADAGVRFERVRFAHGDGPPCSRTWTWTSPAAPRSDWSAGPAAARPRLTRLLLRLMDVDGGRILIGGQDIARLRQADLRSLIAYVPQEPAMFHRSVRDNIAFARPGATEAEILRAARAAHVTEFAESLPDGFDTLVGERGVKLSGGQRQRLALARAILRDAPILLLDEATSALDSESETPRPGSLVAPDAGPHRARGRAPPEHRRPHGPARRARTGDTSWSRAPTANCSRRRAPTPGSGTTSPAASWWTTTPRTRSTADHVRVSCTARSAGPVVKLW